MMIAVYVVVGGLAVGVVAGYLIRRNLASGKLAGAEREAEKLLRDAKREADTIVKEARLEAKEEVHKVRSEVEAELRDRREEVGKAEQRLLQSDEQLDAAGRGTGSPRAVAARPRRQLPACRRRAADRPRRGA